MYCVHSADFFRENRDDQQFSRQFLELFLDGDPQDRCEWFDSLALAIADHIAEFS